MDNKTLQLIRLYEKVLHGDLDEMGIFSCYDTYYKGCWDEDLKKIEELKKELKIPECI